MTRLRHLVVMSDGRLGFEDPAPPPEPEPPRPDVLAGVDPVLVAANRARIEALKQPHPRLGDDDSWVGKLAWAVSAQTVFFVALESSYSITTRGILLGAGAALMLRSCGCPVEYARALARKRAERREAAAKGAPPPRPDQGVVVESVNVSVLA